MAFDGAGQQEGLEIWRIEDFEAVPYDQSKYGKFHTGDSYIVLKTTKKGPKLDWNIHFWLGTETSQDESGTAAFKAVELDDSLEGVPVQHREVQDHESSLFQSYFKNGITYVPGGVKSGFVHVDPDEVVVRLFEVKGTRNVKIKQIPMEFELLNKSDCYILDLGKDQDILVLSPPLARRMEKFKAITAANNIRDEDHAGSAKVEIIDDQNGKPEVFFEKAGFEGKTLDDLPDESTMADADAEVFSNRGIKLFKVSGEGDDISVTEVSEQPLKQSHLVQEELGATDCFILDSGSTTGIFAWIGKESSKEERASAVKHAQKFLENNGLPAWTKVERIVDGGETTTFKQFFSDWKDPEDLPYSALGRVYPEGAIAEWDIADLHAENRSRLMRSAGAAIGFQPDDGSGQIEIFRIENLEPVAQEPEKIGFFFGGDSYVLKYTYDNEEGRPEYIVYFWQGTESTQDERAASAFAAVKMDDDVGGKAIQIRVVQGSEPRHFIKMFKGKMIVFYGGKASGFKNVHDRDSYDEDGTRLFRIRGTCSDDVRAEQVAEVAASLNTDDVFVLETPTATYIWNGKGASDEEKGFAANIVEIVSPGREAQTIAEGEETEDFWNGIGGQGPYQSDNSEALCAPILDPRLFCAIKRPNGKFRLVEMPRCDKKNLLSDEAMILDSGAEIYCWIGQAATEEEGKAALEMATGYLKACPTHRNEDNTPIFVVKEGAEPKSFIWALSPEDEE